MNKEVQDIIFAIDALHNIYKQGRVKITESQTCKAVLKLIEELLVHRRHDLVIREIKRLPRTYFDAGFGEDIKQDPDFAKIVNSLGHFIVNAEFVNEVPYQPAILFTQAGTGEA